MFKTEDFKDLRVPLPAVVQVPKIVNGQTTLKLLIYDEIALILSYAYYGSVSPIYPLRIVISDATKLCTDCKTCLTSYW